MLRSILLCVSLTLASQEAPSPPAADAAQEAAYLAEGTRLLKAMRFMELLRLFAVEMVPPKATPAQRTQFECVLQKLSPEHLGEPMLPAVKARFTLEDLREVNAFLESPLGTKFMAYTLKVFEVGLRNRREGTRAPVPPLPFNQHEQEMLRIRLSSPALKTFGSLKNEFTKPVKGSMGPELLRRLWLECGESAPK